MIEYIVVIAVVGWAAWLVYGKLRREVRGEECSGCSCHGRPAKASKITQIQIPKK
jgi:hypothetical protein